MPSQRLGFRDKLKLRLGYGASSASNSSQPTVASLVKNSPRPSLAKIDSDGNAFKIAWMKFFDELPQEERKAFIDAYESVSPEDLVQEVSDLDRKDSQSAARRLVSPTKDFLTILDQLLAATSSFASLGIPDVASIVIGGARLIIKMALNYVDFFEKLTGMLRKLTAHLAHLREASKLERMVLIQESTANVYVGILKFYHQAYSVFKSRDHQEHTLGHIRRFGRVQWEPFDAKFGEIEGEIQRALDVLSQAKGTEALHQISNLQIESTKQTRMLSEDQRHKYFSWLSPKDFDSIQREGLQKRWPGTGNWLLNHEKYKEWFHGHQPRVLWCHGRPGSGKSVLSSIVMDHIQKDSTTSNAGVGKAFVSFRYDDVETQKPAKIIAAVLKQLSSQVESFPVDLADFLSAHFENHRFPSPEDTNEMISKLNSLFSKTFIVMDALDECEEKPRAEIFQFISRSDAKFFITSRPESSIRETFNFENIPNLEIKTADTQSDIEEYVRGEIESRTRHPTPGELTKSRRLRVRDVETKELIYRTLVDRANGVFLWVKLQLDNICRQANDEDILEVLSDLPEDLFQTYDRILEQIERESKPLRTLVSRCLLWVLNSRRGLSMDELICAVATDPDAIDINTICKKRGKYTHFDIVDVCRNLIYNETTEVDEVDWAVRPIHYSLAEYMDQRKIQNSIVAELQDRQLVELRLAKTCLTFLCTYYSQGGQARWPRYVDSATQFLNYCVLYFDDHVVNAGIEPFENMERHIDQVLSLDEIFLIEIYRERTGMTYWEIEVSVTANDIIHQTLLHEITAVRENGKWKKLALNQFTLIHACSSGSIKQVRTLLDLKVSPRPPVDQTYLSPLKSAIRYNRLDIVKLLLESGADANERYGFSTIFELACVESSTEIIKTLLLHGARGVEGDSSFSMALNFATCADRNSEIALFLLGKGVIPTIKTLWTALFSQSDELLDSILRRRFDLNTEATGLDFLSRASYPKSLSTSRLEFVKGSRPLYFAAALNDVGLVRKLLDSGADIHAKGGNLGTALHAAAFSGNLPTTQLLLENGADIDFCDGELGTPIMTSAFVGHESITKAFMKAGADLKKCHKTSVLHAACHGGSLEFVKTLVGLGADVNAIGASFCSDTERLEEAQETVLQAACARTEKKERLEIIEFLLRSGADVNATNQAETALTAICLNPWIPESTVVETTKLLLDAGARVDTQGVNWGSVLKSCAMRRRSTLLELLLSVRQFKPTQLNTAMEVAATDFHESTMRALLKFGANPHVVKDATTNDFKSLERGEMLLPHVSFHCKVGMVDALLSAGADIDKPDIFGSPLESALGRYQISRNRGTTDRKQAVAATIKRLRQAKAPEPEDDFHIGILCDGPSCAAVATGKIKARGRSSMGPRDHWITGPRYVCLKCQDFNLCATCKRKSDSDGTPFKSNRLVHEEQESLPDNFVETQLLHDPKHEMMEMATRDVEAERRFVEVYST